MIPAATKKLSQFVPEKLPNDHPCKLIMSESSAKVIIKSVTAEQMYPIMIPPTSSVDMDGIFFDSSSTKPMDAMEPAKAASTMAKEETLPVYFKK